MEELELYFRIKELECDIDEMNTQINRLKLEIEKRSFEYDDLKEIYMNDIKNQLEKSTKKEVEIESEQEDIKPKKLRKPNDQPSKNNIEV